MHRWVEDWIRGHYPGKDVHILDCDVRTGRATICVEMGVCDGWCVGVCGGVSERAGSPFYDAARTGCAPYRFDARVNRSEFEQALKS